MSKEKQAEFLVLLKTELPEARIMEFQERGLGTIWGVIISGLQTVTFGALWRLFDVWVNRYTNASIKVSYRTQDDKTVEVTYTKLTKLEAEQMLTQHPPRTDRPIKIILPRSK
jgi:hypothetical protein